METEGNKLFNQSFISLISQSLINQHLVCSNYQPQQQNHNNHSVSLVHSSFLNYCRPSTTPHSKAIPTAEPLFPSRIMFSTRPQLSSQNGLQNITKCPTLSVSTLPIDHNSIKHSLDMILPSCGSMTPTCSPNKSQGSMLVSFQPKPISYSH